MGEYADMEIDRALSFGDNWWYYEPGYEDDAQEDNPFRTLGCRSTARCRHCNSFLRFSLTPNGKWAPVNQDYSPHSCRTRATADEFGPL